MPRISPHAVVDPSARLADDVEVGPFCHIGPDVTIGAGSKLISSVTIFGPTTLGKNNLCHPNVVLGGAPQDRKYKGGATRLEIGDDNLFREAVSIHRGTERGGGVTRLGNNNYLMVNTHLGHDVQLGSNCTLANNVMIGGHAIIGDGVNMMGGAAASHFLTIGEYAFIGAYSRLRHDVPPYCKIDGDDVFRGLNKRRIRDIGFPPEDIAALEDAVRRLFYYRNKPFSLVLAEFDLENGLNPKVKNIVEFLRKRDLGRHGRYLEGMRRK